MGKKCEKCGHEVYARMDDIVENVISSEVEIGLFMKSSIYTDFIHEVNVRIAEVNRNLDDFTLTYSGREYDTFRGGKKILTEMLRIFKDIHDNKVDS